MSVDVYHGYADLTYLEPFENNVKLLLRQGALLGYLIRKRRNQKPLNRGEYFLPQTSHDHDHGGVCQGLFHDGEIVIEIIEQRLQRSCNILLCRGLGNRLRPVGAEIAGDSRHSDALAEHSLESTA